MELSTPTYTPAPTIKNETENPSEPQQAKPLSFSNGVLKRKPLLPFQLHHAVVVEYKECLKNHAAAIGGHALDGCGEFMSSTNTTPSDPTSLKCAACGCHRNFHRRAPEDPFPPAAPPLNSVPAIEYQPHHRHHPPNPHPHSGDHSSPSSPSPPPISSSYYPPAPHMLLALGTGTAAAPNIDTPLSSNPNSRKRHRTKFTQDQKEKMLQFAERVGWKFQKKDEELIVGICDQVGIDKGVLKVWMHNNKNTLGKKDQIFITPPENVNVNGNGNGNGYGGGAEYHHHQQEGGDTSNNNDGRSLNQLHQLLGTTVVNGSASS